MKVSQLLKFIQQFPTATIRIIKYNRIVFEYGAKTFQIDWSSFTYRHDKIIVTECNPLKNGKKWMASDVYAALLSMNPEAEVTYNPKKSALTWSGNNRTYYLEPGQAIASFKFQTKTASLSEAAQAVFAEA